MKKRLSRRMRKMLLVVAAMALVLGLAVGGTMAWLLDTTNEVTNTFTQAGIDIDLKETMKPDGTVVAAGVTDWSVQLIPGMTYKKNPTVSVVQPETDVDIYLFVKFEENVNETILTYESNLTEINGWHQLTGVDGVDNVWYRTVAAGAEENSWELLKDNQVSIADTITKDQTTNANFTMKYTAFAIQTAGFGDDVTDAWAAISGN